jgi:hypothetical protein
VWWDSFNFVFTGTAVMTFRISPTPILRATFSCLFHSVSLIITRYKSLLVLELLLDADQRDIEDVDGTSLNFIKFKSTN